MTEPLAELTPRKALATLKVILGAAWADGSLQPEELPSLKQAVLELGLADHPEIRTLVRTPVSPEEYRRFFQDYLSLHPTPEDRRYLLNTVTRMIYADDELSVEEAYVLDQLRAIVDDLGADEQGLNLGEFQALFSRLLGRRNPSSSN